MAGALSKMKAALAGYKRTPAPGLDDAEEQDEAQATGGEDADPMEDPRSSNEEGTVLYIPTDQFPKGCKAGDKVVITATVESMGGPGGKIGVIPEEIKPENEEEGKVY